jgi:hypothetical protein
MSIEGSAAPAPGAIASVFGPEVETFDERWAAWRAKGVAHDRAVRRKIAIAAPIVIIVAALLIGTVLAR